MSVVTVNGLLTTGVVSQYFTVNFPFKRLTISASFTRALAVARENDVITTYTVKSSGLLPWSNLIAVGPNTSPVTLEIELPQKMDKLTGNFDFTLVDPNNAPLVAATASLALTFVFYPLNK